MTISFGKEFGIGCGDNSCQWGARGGMATNGGCRCVGERQPRETTQGLGERMERLSGIAALRTLADSPAILSALKAFAAAIRESKS